jgi:hypothetical protein
VTVTSTIGSEVFGLSVVAEKEKSCDSGWAEHVSKTFVIIIMGIDSQSRDSAPKRFIGIAGQGPEHRKQQ